VILAVGSQRPRAARALRSLLDQSAIDRMEIFLFDFGPDGCPPLADSSHPRVVLNRLDPTDFLAAARVRGIRAAKAPVICFMEEH
jgi:glycosyltransferase involved in cell wall biosynthesis